MRHAITFEGLATAQKDMADQIPKAIEQALVKQFDHYGRLLNAFQQDMYTSSQNVQAMQDVVSEISTKSIIRIVLGAALTK